MLCISVMLSWGMIILWHEKYQFNAHAPLFIKIMAIYGIVTATICIIMILIFVLSDPIEGVILAIKKAWIKSKD